MSQETLKIRVPSPTARNWKTMAEIKAVFSDDEIITMVHRYCDSQDHAKAYRQRRADKVKVVMAKAKAEGWL